MQKSEEPTRQVRASIMAILRGDEETSTVTVTAPDFIATVRMRPSESCPGSLVMTAWWEDRQLG